jgi:hypothetical protein
MNSRHSCSSFFPANQIKISLLSSGVFKPEIFPAAKWALVTFPDDPYTLSTVYVKII